jgi:hypothetical protein
MRTLSTRILLVATPALFVAGAASGCAYNAAAATNPVNRASASAAATPSSEAPSAKADARDAPPAKADTRNATPAKGAKGIAACRTGDVSAEVIGQSQRAQGATLMAMIRITNASKKACTVDGWPSVAVVNGAGQAVSVANKEVNQPGPAERLVLQPGVGAPAGIKWTACDKADTSCAVGNGLKIGLPGAKPSISAALTEFPAPEKVAITMKSVQVGPLQASREGVVAW